MKDENLYYNMNHKSIPESYFRETCKDRLDELGIKGIINYDGMHKNCIFVDHIGEFKMMPYSIKNGRNPTSTNYIDKDNYLDYMLKKNNTQYANGDIKVLSKITSTQDKVYIQNKYGICKLNAKDLIKNGGVNLASAVNKLDYFVNQVYERSDAYRNGNFKILNFFDHEHLLVEDKYGVCKIHKSNLLMGKSPSVYSALDKDAYITNKFREKHGDQFDYSKVKYVDDTTHVIITCKIHGDFPQMPTNHLRYNRCPKCKEDEDKFTRTTLMKRVNKKGSGILYCIKVYDDEESFIKIGYTTNSVARRYGFLKPRCNYNYDILKEVLVDDGERLFNIENLMKNTFRKNKYEPIRPFPGSKTEVFHISKYNDILKEIEQFETTLS